MRMTTAVCGQAPLCNCFRIYLICPPNTITEKVREKSRESHNHKPQPFPDPKRKKNPTNLNKHKPNKRTKSTKISSLFPKRGNRNTKRTEKHKNKMTHGKTYNKSPRRINHKATKNKTNIGTTALELRTPPLWFIVTLVLTCLPILHYFSQYCFLRTVAIRLNWYAVYWNCSALSYRCTFLISSFFDVSGRILSYVTSFIFSLLTSFYALSLSLIHYENKPIQIYYHKDKNSDIFIFLLKTYILGTC